ncbi:HAD family hydrolase [Mycoplasma sp. ATU-Cv-703]|uniref:HAD-IIB family hydrolase n=1 Tax=Mycoplasma sp. ATU-Cv-703 TaxID=2498595 RepID=UPI000FDE753F
MKRALLIDLDGTLLDDQNKISVFNQKMINQARQAGWQVYLVTGKSFQHSYQFYKKLGLDSWFITSAGQVISRKNEIVWQKTISFLALKKLFNEPILNQNVDDFMVQTAQQILATNPNSPVIGPLFGQKIPVKKIAWNTPFQAIGCYFTVKKQAKLTVSKITQTLSRQYKTDLDFHPWEIWPEKTIIHVVPSQVSKYTAFMKVKKWDQITYTVVFGNGRNDIPLFKKADLSYAMLGSTPEVVSYATSVSNYDNNHSGVGREIQKLLKLL